MWHNNSIDADEKYWYIINKKGGNHSPPRGVQSNGVITKTIKHSVRPPAVPMTTVNSKNAI